MFFKWQFLSISMETKEKPMSELLKFSFINIDKPSGPTSFTVSQFIKNQLKISKTSHLGTLDPMVSGVLPIALGRACRLNDYFMHKDKTYVGIMRVHKDVSLKDLEEQIKNFIGKIQQLPPVKSRVKRAVREREVKTLRIAEKQGKDFLFDTQVQAGTYIRKLIHDLGEKIGGAHMLELRRTKAGIFSEEEIFTLYDFEKAVEEYNLGSEESLRKMLIPAEEAIKKVLPAVQLIPDAKPILTGKPLMKSDVKDVEKIPDETFALFKGERFIAIMRPVEEGDIIARPEFVLN